MSFFIDYKDLRPCYLFSSAHEKLSLQILVFLIKQLGNLKERLNLILN